MPDSVFLLPGVGAQGGQPDDLGAAFANARGGALVSASRSVAGAEDPARAAEELRERVWDVACRASGTG
jgi:orotidine-5'-phosphate decarboxylase